MNNNDNESIEYLLDRLEQAYAADQVEMTDQSAVRYRTAREAVEDAFGRLRYNITSERMTCDISDALRRLANGRPEIASLLVEAADKLDSLITLLAKAEAERDEARDAAQDVCPVHGEAVARG